MFYFDDERRDSLAALEGQLHVLHASESRPQLIHGAAMFYKKCELWHTIA